MHYNQEYVNESQHAYACTPTQSFHAPAYFPQSELPSNAWNGPQYRGHHPFQYVQSPAPSTQRMPANFSVTPGYYHSGCWYNAGLQKQPVALVQQQEVMMQPPSAPAQLQQGLPPSYPLQQGHAGTSYPLQQGHAGTSYPLQQGHAGTSYPFQQGHAGTSYPLQQGHAGTSYPLQQGHAGTSHQEQQFMLPSCPLPQEQQQHQVMPPSYPLEPVQQYQVIPQVMPVPQIVREETPRNQAQVVEATRPQETTPIPPQLVEISLGPGVHVTRSQDKLTIDIGLSNVDNAATEKHGCLEDMICELFQLIKGCAFSNRAPRPRRNRVRHQVTSKRPCKAGSNDAEKSSLMEDKDTQTIEAMPSAPNQMEELVAQASDLAGIPATDESPEVPSLTRTLIQEQPVAVAVAQNDLINNQVREYFPDPEQQKMAKPKATNNAAPKSALSLAEKTLQPMISACLEPIVKATPPLLLPEVCEHKDALANTCYWPSLGSRLPTKASKGKPCGSPAKSKQREYRFNKNIYVGSSSGSASQVSDNLNGLAFQPKRILRNLKRCENELSKPSGGKVEVKVPDKAAQDKASRSRNDKKLQKSQQGDVLSLTQIKKHSFQGCKRNQLEPQSVAGNMFALLDEPWVEPASEIKDEANSLQADAEDKDSVDAPKRVARKSKKLKRQIKKKERARRMRLEAKEKAAKEAATRRVRSPSPEVPSPFNVNCEAELESQVVADIPTKSYKIMVQDIIKKHLEYTTRTVADDVLKETPTEGHTAGENCIVASPSEECGPSANDPEWTLSPAKATVERDQVSRLATPVKILKRLRFRSQFLDAVSGYATARKSPEENQLPRKRKLWEKRKPEV